VCRGGHARPIHGRAAHNPEGFCAPLIRVKPAKRLTQRVNALCLQRINQPERMLTIIIQVERS
jgi:hypothetical protein